MMRRPEKPPGSGDRGYFNRKRLVNVRGTATLPNSSEVRGILTNASYQRSSVRLLRKEAPGEKGQWPRARLDAN
jgi:hypothetical protein